MNAKQRKRALQKRQEHARSSRGRVVTREYQIDGRTVIIAHVAGPKHLPKEEL